MRKIIVCFCACLLLALVVKAETIYLKNGEVVRGKIIHNGTMFVQIETNKGNRTIETKDVKSISLVDKPPAPEKPKVQKVTQPSPAETKTPDKKPLAEIKPVKKPASDKKTKLALILEGGAAFALTQEDFLTTDAKKVGKTGPSFGAQFLIEPFNTRVLSLGVEIKKDIFKENSYTETIPLLGTINISDKPDVLTIMPVVKIATVKSPSFYLLGGAGYYDFGREVTMEIVTPIYIENTTTFSCSGIGFTAGAGVDFSLSDRAFFGLEGRWTLLKTDEDEVNIDTFEYLNALIHFGVRF